MVCILAPILYSGSLSGLRMEHLEHMASTLNYSRQESWYASEIICGNVHIMASTHQLFFLSAYLGNLDPFPMYGTPRARGINFELFAARQLLCN